MIMNSLFAGAAACIAECDATEKARLSRDVAAQWRNGEWSLQFVDAPLPIGAPGRPPRPLLVSPRELPKRGFNSPQGRAALIHAVAHIEFNAINLAWDAVYRFRDMPQAFYDDWVRVADEEAYHFSLLQARLRALGYDYGDFNAHNGLWEMARDTAHDVLVRMALVPRVLEARGLDVTPGMMTRLRAAGDEDTVALLEIILRDEIGHVEIGSRWFRRLCEQRGLVAESVFRDLIQRYMKGRIKGPFHRDARLQAGFSESELAALEQMGRTA
jgi:uncharacterized ferritin-like protein (DUF455 family)